jgi:hypothetical protein
MAYERSSGSGMARIVSAVFAFIAIILILHIVLVLADASAASGIVKGIADFASTLAWGFKALFSFTSAKVTVFVNYGLAALVYLFVGGVLVRLFRNAS